MFVEKEKEIKFFKNICSLPRHTCKKLLDLAPIDIDGLHQRKQFYSESFDYVFLDPAYSALGLRPTLNILPKSTKDLQYFNKMQRELVRNDVVSLKTGGMENEEMVHFVLNEYSNMIDLVPIDSLLLVSQGLPVRGFNEYQRNCIHPCFDPSDTNDDTICYFIAKIQKMNSNTV